MEKNRRKAFWGVQLKYTLAPILWLYGIVFLGLTGMYLYNWFTEFAKSENEVSLVEQLGYLPLGISFFVLVIGVQVILGIGYAKQERNELAMKRILLPKEMIDMIRLNFSLLVTFSAFLFYFLMICLLGITENLLAPQYAYGGTELFSAFYYYAILYNVYPVVSVWTIPRFIVCVAAASVMSPMLGGVSSNSIWEYTRWERLVGGMVVGYLFSLYCFDESFSPISDIIWMVFFGFFYVRKVVITYGKKYEDDREEGTVKSQC